MYRLLNKIINRSRNIGPVINRNNNGTMDGKEDPVLSKFLSFQHSSVVVKITY